MSDTTLRTVIRLALLVHAIGHVQGIVVSLGLFSTENWHPRSWLLTESIGEDPSRMIALVLWSSMTLGFLLVTAGACGWEPMNAHWRGLGLVLAVFSLAGIVVYWNSFALIFNKVGAIAINAVLIWGVLIANWPSTDVIA